MDEYQAISYGTKERSHKAIHVSSLIWRGAELICRTKNEIGQNKVLRLRGLKRVFGFTMMEFDKSE